MLEWLSWFKDPGNSQIFALLLFFVTYCLILLWVFTGKQRKRRFDAYRHIPLEDEPEDRQVSADRNEDNDR